MDRYAPLNASLPEYASLEKGKSIYSWESAMKHHCGTCYEKIKHTCIVKHCVVCPKYHGTLFMRGRERSCKSCIESAQDLERQARDIAVLLSQLCGFKANENEVEQPSSPCSPFGFGKISKKERKLEKAIEKTAARKRNSMSLQNQPDVANVLLAYSEEGQGIEGADHIAVENVQSLLRFPGWPEGPKPQERDAILCASVLAVLGLRCRCITDQPAMASSLSMILFLILRAINSINVEARGTKARIHSFERVTSRKTAEAMRRYLEEAGH